MVRQGGRLGSLTGLEKRGDLDDSAAILLVHAKRGQQ